jgi:hypothetical protein
VPSKRKTDNGPVSGGRRWEMGKRPYMKAYTVTLDNGDRFWVERKSVDVLLKSDPGLVTIDVIKDEKRREDVVVNSAHVVRIDNVELSY